MIIILITIEKKGFNHYTLPGFATVKVDLVGLR